MVLHIARQGIYINRACLIARQSIHLLPVNPLRGIRDRRYLFFY
jgi:hypothetical protein